MRDGAYAQFSNTKTGFKTLRRWVGNIPLARVVYESTGAYHGAMERALADHLPLVKVNLLQAKRFAQSIGARARTDRADAKMLAQIGAALQLEPDEARSQNHPEI